MPSILGANTLSSGYDVANSARFNDGDSAYMNLTSVNTVTNRLKFTISLWVKRSTLGAKSMIGTVGGDNSNFGAIWFDSNDKLNCTEGSGGGELNFITNRVFRDVSAWYHIVLAIDTTQGTESNRVKIYVNGVQETSFGTSTYPSQNSNMHLNRGGKAQYLGRHTDSSNDYYFDGYMAEVVWIDGSQEAVTSFGEFDSDSGIWKPKDVSGLTFGNNGFYLDFEDSANLGNDVNGGTDWTENNFAATDQTTDTCTNNFCVINPLVNGTQTNSRNPTLSEGNTFLTNTSSAWMNCFSSFAVDSGKWYFEAKVTKHGTSYAHLGIYSVAQWENEASGWPNFGDPTSSFSYDGDGNIVNSGSNANTDPATYTTNDIIGIAVDLDNNKFYAYKNNSLQVSGGTNITADTEYYLGGMGYNYNIAFNFGNPSYANSSDAADGNGYGAFEFAPPSGFYSLCSKNLAEYG